MRAAPWVLTLGVALAAACGGKSQQVRPSARDDGGDGPVGTPGGGASSTGAGTGTVGPDCAVTIREPRDEVINATTLEMVSRAKPETRVPLYIGLVAVDVSDSAPKAEKERAFDPYQSDIEERLLERGASDVGRYWSSNAMSATLEARFVSELLCWPNVVHVEVSAPYWKVADPPWGPDDAGSDECPLNADATCPEHCFELRAVPYMSEPAPGCFTGRELVACSRGSFEFDDGDYLCRQRVKDGKPYLFTVEPPPEAPAFLGWQACEDPTAVLCDDEG